MAQDFPLQRVLVTEGRSRNTIQREHVRAEAEKTSQGAPSTVCTLKTPNKAPQAVKDQYVSTLCSATW